MKDNPFTAKAKKPKLKPFGGVSASKAKNGSDDNGKLNPFAIVAKKVDVDKHELEQIAAGFKVAEREWQNACKEEAKLFKTVDKLSLAGKTDTDRYHEAKHAWDAAWRRIDRAYSTMQTLSARKSKIKRRGDHARNGKAHARSF